MPNVEYVLTVASCFATEIGQLRIYHHGWGADGGRVAYG